MLSIAVYAVDGFFFSEINAILKKIVIIQS